MVKFEDVNSIFRHTTKCCLLKILFGKARESKIAIHIRNNMQKRQINRSNYLPYEKKNHTIISDFKGV